MAGRSRFFLLTAVALNVVTFWGFSETYFAPLLSNESAFGGRVSDLPFIVHLHGWSFFLWYLLLLWQASLIYKSRRRLHRHTGMLSIGLVAVMTVTGLIIIPVNIFNESQTTGPPIWTLFGPVILATLFLFVAFYAQALRHRKSPSEHKRYIILASAPALGAAVFRVLLNIFGPNMWNIPAGILLTNIFIIAGMVHDRYHDGRVHTVYWVGLAVCLFVEIALMALPHTPIGEPVRAALSTLGETLFFLYD